MTRLEFNMKLNALVTDALEDGFDLGWIADTLKGVSNEILDEDNSNDSKEEQ